MLIKRKCGLISVAIVLLSAAGFSQTTVVNTIDVPNEGTSVWDLVDDGDGIVSQWFTVPEGKTGTGVKMFVDVGNALDYGHAQSELVLRVRDDANSDDVLYTTRLHVQDLGGTTGWISVTGMSLPPSSDYFMHLAGSSAAGATNPLNTYMSVRKEVTAANPDYYPGGYAASGTSPASAVGDRIDFLAKITCVPGPVRTIDVIHEGLSTYGLSGTGALGQFFTVPPEHTCTEMRIRVSIGDAQSHYTTHQVVFRIRDHDNGDAVVASMSKGINEWSAETDWMVLSDMNLPPGSNYYASVLTNVSGLENYIRMFKENTPANPDYYPYGYAAYGYTGNTPLGNNIDLQTEITLVPPQGTLIIVK